MKLLLFKISTCGPCKVLTKILSSYKPTELVVDENEEAEELADKYEISSVPTVVILDNEGNEVGRFVGSRTKEQLEEELKKYSND